jgi:hypothetical protein
MVLLNSPQRRDITLLVAMLVIGMGVNELVPAHVVEAGMVPQFAVVFALFLTLAFGLTYLLALVPPGREVDDRIRQSVQLLAKKNPDVRQAIERWGEISPREIRAIARHLNASVSGYRRIRSAHRAAMSGMFAGVGLAAYGVAANDPPAILFTFSLACMCAAVALGAYNYVMNGTTALD